MTSFSERSLDTFPTIANAIGEGAEDMSMFFGVSLKPKVTDLVSKNAQVTVRDHDDGRLQHISGPCDGNCVSTIEFDLEPFGSPVVDLNKTCPWLSDIAFGGHSFEFRSAVVRPLVKDQLNLVFGDWGVGADLHNRGFLPLRDSG